MATITRSKRAAARRTRSTWPTVSGSNDPGHTATRRSDGRISAMSLLPGPAIEAERAAARCHLARACQAAHLRGSPAASRVLEHQHAIRRHKGRQFGQCAEWIHLVRGIQKDEIEEHVELPRNPAVQIQTDDSIATGNPTVREVSANQLDRARIAIGKRHMGRAAADGFDTYGAGSGAG